MTRRDAKLITAVYKVNRQDKTRQVTRPSLRQRRSGSSQIHTADLFAPVYSFCPGRGASFATCLTFSFANTLSGLRLPHGHGTNAPLSIGGAISGSYRRPRCSRRPPPVARGVARVLCLGQTGHRDNPTESSEDARTPSSPDQNRLLPARVAENN